MAKYDDNDGVWRTIGGRRVFIKKGQSMSDAMKESGKFKAANKTDDTKENVENREKNLRKSNKDDEQFEVGDLKRKALERLPKEDIDSHEGDLYIKKTKESEALINNMKNKDNGMLSTFKDQQTGETWYDIPFANMEDDLQSNDKHAGWELYSDDPHRYDDEISSREARREKYKATKHIGFGDYNDDDIPVYKNDIDYTGNFSNANLKNMTDDDLIKALNVQSEEYKKATNEKLGDQRTRNGRMDKIFNTQKVQQYEAGMNKLNEEINKRDLPRYNIYDKKNPDVILVSSPTKELAEKQIQDMYRTDMKLKKTYNWQDAPQYDFRVGKVDEYLNERDDYKQNAKNDYKLSTYEKEMIKATNEKDEQMRNKAIGQRYSGTIDYLKQSTNLGTDEIMKIIKKMIEESNK